MRKALFLMISLALLASCSVKTNEEKACELIEPDVKANLIKPESYEFAQIRLDSCFSDSQYNPEALAFAMKVAKLYGEYKEYASDAERAESSMTIYAPSYGYQSAHDKQQQKKYKAEMEKAQRKADAIRVQILSVCKEKQSQLLASPPKHEFMGWMAVMTYRVETAGGIKIMTESIYFLNNDLTEITARFSREDLEELQSASITDFEEEFGNEISNK